LGRRGLSVKKMKQMPAILHINTEKGFRGGEIQTVEIARRLQSRGFPTVLMASEKSPLVERARAAGIETVEFSPRGELDIFSALKIKKVVSQFDIKLVHAHTSQALGLTYLSRIHKNGVPVVATRRVSFPFSSRLSIKKYLIASKIIAVAEGVAEGLSKEGVPADKILIIHSGIDLDQYRKLPDKEILKDRLGVKNNFPVIGVVGALAHHKGHQTFIRALNKLWIKYPQAIAVFVGDGPAAADIKRSIESRGLPALFVGHVQNVVPIYRAFDVFVLPSSSGEGSPGVVKEAAASMVPVVATNVGGTREILRSGVEAILVPPSDPNKMAEAIMVLLEDEKLRTRFTLAAKARVEAFSFDKVVEAHERTYLDLLGLNA
jgi:L-malate glycosyltransferase